MDDENSSRTSIDRPAPVGPKYPSLRHKTAFVGVDDARSMSSLRVVNVSPREEPPQYFNSNIDAAHNHLPDSSPVSTPGEANTHVQLFSQSPYYSIQNMSSPIASPAPESVTDAIEERVDEQNTDSVGKLEYDQDVLDEFELDSFNLKAPPPRRPLNNLESLANRFFSADHLDTILRDPSLAVRFMGFLESYRPQHVSTLKQYTETRKVVKALEYANLAAGQISSQHYQPPLVAARLDSRFEAMIQQLGSDLVDEALPAYLTHHLTSLVTDTLVKEITGNNAPVMRELIPSLAEVYCISDPSLPDNPIVYASEGELASSD